MSTAGRRRPARWRPQVSLLLPLLLPRAAGMAQRAALSGLWVCEPAVRSMLERPELAVSRGELLGRCRETFAPAACDAAQSALGRGKSVLDSLETVCGPTSAAQSNEAVFGPGGLSGRAGLGGASVGRGGTGFGPLGNGVRLSGYTPRTSFRGPQAPPAAAGGADMDKALRGKKVGESFRWERSSKDDANAMDKAADAVRVYNAVALGSGNTPMEGSRAFPQAASVRAADLADSASDAVPDESTVRGPVPPAAAAAAAAPAVAASAEAESETATASPTVRTVIPEVTPLPSAQEAASVGGAEPFVWYGDTATWENATEADALSLRRSRGNFGLLAAAAEASQ
eukprot:TRINITY_DN708_c0_g1_i1.p1 TRINITY_DN708_c0_g1~~TRINITY_DN708_c0_g1_i1.p1  ORF type:complete len:342 (-),score=76.63 TRINITY_DN708_c0_g1_i1:149-1174(-)